MTAHLEFTRSHLKDSQTMRNKIFCSNKTKIELFDLNARHHVWRNPGTASHMDNAIPIGSTVVAALCCGAAGTVSLVRVEWKMNEATYRDIPDDNLLQSALEYTAKITKNQLWDRSVNLLECRSPSRLTELERFYKEEWVKLPKNRYAKLAASDLKRGYKVLLKVLHRSREQRLWVLMYMSYFCFYKFTRISKKKIYSWKMNWIHSGLKL